MASGYPGRDYYSALGYMGSGGSSKLYVGNGGSGGVGVKRLVTEVERQQQLQQALFLRSVKQKTLQSSPISTLSPIDLSVFPPEIAQSSTSSSSTLSFSQSFGFAPSQQMGGRSSGDISFSLPAKNSSAAMQNRLLELEKQLLDDEEENEPTASVGSAVTTTHTDWADEMEQLLSTPPPPPAIAAVPLSQASTASQNPVSPSPTTSSSSSSSSTASCSPSSSPSSSRQLIIDTAAAIAEGNMELAAANVAVLKRSANPRGDPEQRLITYMVGALLCRMNPSPPGLHPATELCTPEHFAASKVFVDSSPPFKLALSAANFAILDACKDFPKIHVIDFDVRSGAQFASLVHGLADHCRHHLPPLLHITAVCDPSFPFNNYNSGSGGGDCLKTVGEKLVALAERVGVVLRFNIVRLLPSELDRVSLECEQGEALAVNFAFILSRVADESVSPANPRDDLLRRVRALSPTIVTLAEQELNTNTAPLAGRAAEACAHYGAIFESLDGVVSRESRERAAVEACLGRKAANSIGRDGADRVERCEVFGKWRARMCMAGFKPIPLSQAVIRPVQTRLDSIRSSQKQNWFSIKNESDAVWLGWNGRSITVASAWR